MENKMEVGLVKPWWIIDIFKVKLLSFEYQLNNILKQIIIKILIDMQQHLHKNVPQTDLRVKLKSHEPKAYFLKPKIRVHVHPLIELRAVQFYVETHLIFWVDHRIGCICFWAYEEGSQHFEFITWGVKYFHLILAIRFNFLHALGLALLFTVEYPKLKRYCFRAFTKKYTRL